MAEQEKWRSPATIPNTEGTWIVCLLKSGHLRLDTVVKVDGLHSLAATPITEVEGWRPHTLGAFTPRS